jgi:hypothetical protein
VTKFDEMDRQIEELINHELLMQNKNPIEFAPHTSDEDEGQEEDLYQMVTKRGVGGGLK